MGKSNAVLLQSNEKAADGVEHLVCAKFGSLVLGTQQPLRTVVECCNQNCKQGDSCPLRLESKMKRSNEPELRESEKVAGKVFMYLCFIAVAYWLAGCSTLTNGTTQTVTIKSDRPCEASVDDKSTPITPEQGTVLVARSSKPMIVKCQETVVAEVQPSVTAAGWTSIMWLDFGLVDSLTGALWGYPETVDVRGAK